MTAQKEIYNITKLLKTGLMYHQTGQLKKAEEAYTRILEADPNQPDALHLSGVIAHQFGKPESAISFIKRALLLDSSQPFFHNNLGNAFSAIGDQSEAIVCFRKAIQLNPKYAEAHSNLGDMLQIQKDIDGAVDEYKKALELKPDLTEAAINLGHVLRIQGKFEEAIYWYQFTLKKNPGNPDAHYYIGAVYFDRKDYNSAIFFLKKALSIDSNHVDAHFKLGMTKKEMGHWDEAIYYYQKTLSINPDLAETYTNMGLVYKAQQRLSESVLCYRKALQLNPDLPEAHNNLGTCLQELGKFREAISSFRKALQIRPGYAEALVNVGNTLQRIGQSNESIAYYRKALSVNPDFAQAYYHMGVAFQDQRKAANAIPCFQKAMALYPDLKKADCYLFFQLQQTCSWEKLDDLRHKIDRFTDEDLKKGNKTNEMPFLSLIRHQDPKRNLLIAESWSKNISRRMSGLDVKFTFDLKRSSQKKIKVGYLSNRFRRAPTGQLTVSLFGLHNRDEFEIHCYSYGKDDGSIFRKRIMNDCDRFIDITNLGDVEAAKCIFNNDVDILVEMKGYTRNNRLGVSALRPAPVQISYLGFTGTTGADFIDYIITDRIVTPEPQSYHYSEKFIYMPNCYMVNSHKPVVSNRKWKREDFGLPEDGFVFCSFGLPYKIDCVLFDSWMKILENVPNGILWLLEANETVKKKLMLEAESRGISPERLTFSKKLPLEEHLARHRLADLVLDTLTNNGHTTTSDALWAGVPVLTLQGNHFMSRVSSSLLTAIGMQELIVHSLKEYEDFAIRLARSPDKIDVICQKLEKNRLVSPLFDTPKFTRNLENAYKSIWDIYMSGQDPRRIDVIENVT